MAGKQRSKLGAVSMLLSPYIPAWMGAEPAIREEASRYFFIISVPMLFRSASTILGAAIRATKDTRTPMIVNLAANAVNAGLNYLLIYALKMGVTGAALASAISYTLSGTMMFVVYRRSRCLGWRFREWRFDKGLIADCGKVSLPVLERELCHASDMWFLRGLCRVWERRFSRLIP